MRLLVSMGIRAGGRTSAPLRPLLREVDVDRGVVVRDLTWETDPGWMSAPDADQEFTAPAWLDDRTLLQPTHTEVLAVDVARWRARPVASHPLFHSVHSAAPRPGGGVVVSSAGNESVVALDADGALAAHHFLRPGPFAVAYPDVTDFRRAHHDAFKPHSHHPNHAAYAGGDLWVTCFETREAVALGSGRRIRFDGIPHDGRLVDGRLWFTLVSGQVVVADPETATIVDRLDVHALDGRPHLLGWCRGIEVVGDRLFVGMTTLRSTTHREVLRRVLRGARGVKLPTRIVEIDLRERRIVREIPVGNEAGGTIYGLSKIP